MSSGQRGTVGLECWRQTQKAWNAFVGVPPGTRRAVPVGEPGAPGEDLENPGPGAAGHFRGPRAGLLGGCLPTPTGQGAANLGWWCGFLYFKEPPLVPQVSRPWI